jgi:phosphotriesterase-related protein
MVATARGQVPGERLGRVLMHEHLVVGDHELAAAWPRVYRWDRDRVVEEAVRRLQGAAEAGVDTIVDVTVMGLGRDIDLIARIAQRSPVAVVVATGAYVERDLPAPLQLRGPGRTAFGGPEPLVGHFVSDIRDGIADSGIRAGIIKCATERHGLTKHVDRVLRAAAQASLETGVAITTHTNARARVGLDQQRVFAEEGVDPARVVIGHCGDTDDLDYLRALLDGGTYLGMDRFGLDYFLPTERRVAVVARLCAEGHAGRLVLSQDSVCGHIAYTAEEMGRLAPRSSLRHVLLDVVPALSDAGVTAEQIDRMLIHNPRAILDGGSAAPVG